MADLRKCYSEDDLLTVPWRFLLSFFPLPCSSIFLASATGLTAGKLAGRLADEIQVNFEKLFKFSLRLTKV